MLFLNIQELEQLTGYTQKAAQVRWLQRNGVRHFVRCDGRAIVPVTAIEGRQEQQKPAVRTEPNLDAVRRHSR